jgi:hypothetical protein
MVLLSSCSRLATNIKHYDHLNFQKQLCHAVTAQGTEIFQSVIVSKIKSKNILYLRPKTWERMGVIGLELKLQVFVNLIVNGTK